MRYHCRTGQLPWDYPSKPSGDYIPLDALFSYQRSAKSRFPHLSLPRASCPVYSRYQKGGAPAATGQIVNSVLTLIVGELLKLVLVERLFSLTRAKLMKIPTFAWAYGKFRQAKHG
jgi:hypothetical protein